MRARGTAKYVEDRTYAVEGAGDDDIGGVTVRPVCGDLGTRDQVGKLGRTSGRLLRTWQTLWIVRVVNERRELEEGDGEGNAAGTTGCKVCKVSQWARAGARGSKRTADAARDDEEEAERGRKGGLGTRD